MVQKMRSLKTVFVCLSLAVSAAGPARSQEDLRKVFASCAGQYSAMLEHAWLMQDPEADDYQRLRAEFLALLDAVGPGDRALLAYRIEAKFAMAGLLSQAAFGTGEDRSQRASQHAHARLDACRLILLGG